MRQFTPTECISEFSLCFYPVAFSIGYIVLYSICFLGAVLEEKFAKQNGPFEEFVYSNVLQDTMVTRRKIFLKKPPLLVVSFKSMT